MITYLDGCLAELLPGRLTIDVSGLGYEVLVPLSTSDTMPPIGEKVRMLIHFHVREQEQSKNSCVCNVLARQHNKTSDLVTVFERRV